MADIASIPTDGERSAKPEDSEAVRNIGQGQRAPRRLSANWEVDSLRSLGEKLSKLILLLVGNEADAADAAQVGSDAASETTHTVQEPVQR